MRNIFKTLSVFLLFTTTGFADESGLVANPELETARPNVVFLVSEDNSKHYLKLFDEHGAETPHIESLAESGLIFRNAFSNSPVCSVARTTLATGCYAARIGTQFHRRSTMVPLPDGLKMFPAYLRDAGYYTSNRQKMDFNAIPGGEVWDQSSRNATWRNRSDSQPFFHMQSFSQSHEGSLHFPEDNIGNKPTVANPADVFVFPFHPQTETFAYTNARYLDNIATIDEKIGEVLDQLEADGLMDDTFVFYFSDHGGVLPRGKGYVYETGLHVPLVMHIPENFRSLVEIERGEEVSGFVSFIDFGPTVLNLCGIETPEQIDGTPFLGPGVSMSEVQQRDETFGYADRFDEKYDLVRSLRKGNFKYMRNFTPFNYDGLQNNYRYRMAAYREWRELFESGDLNEIQSQFFEVKPVEALYDLEADPYETINLIHDPQYAGEADILRRRLFELMGELPDLSLFPESFLYANAIESPVEFGLENKDQIRKLLETANLALNDYSVARLRLEDALRDPDAMVRYWAVVACSSFGRQAEDLSEHISELASSDPSLVVRVRAAEFLGLTGTGDPVAVLRSALASTTSQVEAMEILNTVVLLRDGAAQIDCEIKRADVPAELNQERSDVERRLDYLDPVRD
ncbi:MAG: sulfatase-like hydrolase/transferase [Planctomycetota bacterium]